MIIKRRVMIITGSALVGVTADQEEERFDAYDDQHNVIGTELRHVCHQKGILHKAVYCFVFNQDHELLIQRRSAHKKVGPNEWDLSVAEHLQPGESYKEGVLRGLSEELGINLQDEDCRGPLSPMHQRRLVVPGVLDDHELVESYFVDGFNGPIHFNTEEVSEVKFVSLSSLRKDIKESPGEYTSWFRQEVASLNFFE
jgi:isopentenyl-diphosphate delta-isomerase